MPSLTLCRSLVVVALLHHGSCLLPDAASYETAEDRLFTELFETRNYRKLSRPALRVADMVNVRLQLVLKKIVELANIILCDKYVDYIQVFIIPLLLAYVNWNKFSKPMFGIEFVVEQLQWMFHVQCSQLKSLFGHGVIQAAEGALLYLIRNTAYISCHKRWNDYRLTWNASEYDGLDVIFIPASKLWIPDILQVTNAKDDSGKIGKTEDLSTKLVQVTPNGNCVWYPTSLLLSYCSVDVSMFPFDKQNCAISYELWGHDAGHVQLSALRDKVDLRHYQENGEWNLIGTELSTTSVYYPSSPFPYFRLNFLFHLRRKSLYYVFNFIVPCCTFSVVSLATFLLQPGGGERIGLSVSILLGLSVYQSIINERLPETSDHVPLLGVYFMFVMIMAALSVLMPIVMNCLGNHRLANALGIRSSNARSLRKLSDGSLPSDVNQHNIHQTLGHVGIAPDNTSPTTDIQNQKLLLDEVKADDRCPRRSTLVNVVDSSNISTTADGQAKHITTLLPTENTDHQVGDLEEEAATSDWMLVARVLDRIFFIVFSLALVAGTLTLLIMATVSG